MSDQSISLSIKIYIKGLHVISRVLGIQWERNENMWARMTSDLYVITAQDS